MKDKTIEETIKKTIESDFRISTVSSLEGGEDLRTAIYAILSDVFRELEVKHLYMQDSNTLHNFTVSNLKDFPRNPIEASEDSFAIDLSISKFGKYYLLSNYNFDEYIKGNPYWDFDEDFNVMGLERVRILEGEMTRLGLQRLKRDDLKEEYTVGQQSLSTMDILFGYL